MKGNLERGNFLRMHSARVGCVVPDGENRCAERLYKYRHLSRAFAIVCLISVVRVSRLQHWTTAMEQELGDTVSVVRSI